MALENSFFHPQMKLKGYADDTEAPDVDVGREQDV